MYILVGQQSSAKSNDLQPRHLEDMIYYGPKGFRGRDSGSHSFDGMTNPGPDPDGAEDTVARSYLNLHRDVLESLSLACGKVIE